MENENIMEEQAVELPAEENQEQPAEAQEQAEQPDELVELRSEVTELKLRLALLAGGAAPEKLDEGVKLAAGLMAAQGEEAESAAGEVLLEYPHIKLAKRAVPQFSAECSGKGDGFAAIRNIFAKR